MKEQTILIEADAIKIGRYLRYSMEAYLKNNWWIYALLLGACVVLSFVNINFLFVAIVLLFMVFTMILFLVVVYYGLVPESRFSTLPKVMTLDENGIHFCLKKKRYTDDSEEESEQPEYDIEETVLPWQMIKGLETKDDCMLLFFKRPKYAFVAIPYTAFFSESHLRSAVSLIMKSIQKWSC